ncbi:MAG: hypothetical protein OXD54_13540 [Candidatus Poribacteria bacterium]|nr:hypothetical protein [Candidatus Poribacteria bacterium]
MADKENRFNRISISIASPDQIKDWAKRTSCKRRNPANDVWSCAEKDTCDCGEIKKAETINYRSFRPEHQGLFCEATFGPQKDFECSCGKYKRIKHKGLICDQCGVEVTKSQVRRERLGYIKLATPVSHIWFFKGIPSRLGTFLELASRQVERVLYFDAFIVTEVTDESCGLAVKDILTEIDVNTKLREHPDAFKAGTGAEAIQELLRNIDLPEDVKKFREELEATSSHQKKVKLSKQLKMVAGFDKAEMQPDWMILDVLPVISPDLRPLVSLEGGRFATSDLNDLYRRVINRNNRLQKLIDLRSPEVILRNEKRMLQESVDAFLDNGRHGRRVTGPGKRALKSLSDILKGKVGRFRQNLLGKRVDYSGRSVIVVGPELELHQCGLPKLMAVELFKPFIIEKLLTSGEVQTIKRGKYLTEHVTPDSPVWEALEEVIADHPVLLNRPPTLHRLGIQAFMPVLVEGKSIRIPPLVCKAFNADFDGDQMAVHVPLSIEARAEAKMLLLSSGNILKPSHGEPISVPELDMILGASFLTKELPEHQGRAERLHAAYAEKTKKKSTFAKLENEDWAKRRFTSLDEVTHAHGCGTLKLHDSVVLFFKGVREPILTTVGRVIFNEVLPHTNGSSSLIWKDEVSGLELPFFNEEARSKRLSELIKTCFNELGTAETVSLLDRLQKLSFEYATRSGISPGIKDYPHPIYNEVNKEVNINAAKSLIKLSEVENKLVENHDELSKLLKNPKETQQLFIKNRENLKLCTDDLKINGKLSSQYKDDLDQIRNLLRDSEESSQFMDTLHNELLQFKNKTEKVIKMFKDSKELCQIIDNPDETIELLEKIRKSVIERIEDPKKLKKVMEDSEKVSKLLEDPDDLAGLRTNLDKVVSHIRENLVRELQQHKENVDKISELPQFVDNLDNTCILIKDLKELKKFTDNLDGKHQQLIGILGEVGIRLEVLEELTNLSGKLDKDLPKLKNNLDIIREPLQDITSKVSELLKDPKKLIQIVGNLDQVRKLLEDPKKLIQIKEYFVNKSELFEDPKNPRHLRNNLASELQQLASNIDTVSELPQLKGILEDINELLKDPKKLIQNKGNFAKLLRKFSEELVKASELPQLRDNLDELPNLIKNLIPKSKELTEYLHDEKSKFENILGDIRTPLRNLDTEELDNEKIRIWSITVNKVGDTLFTTLPETKAYLVEQGKDVEGFSPVHLMADSGARARKNPFTQISAIVGLKSKQSGEILSTPIQSSYREGLDVLDYFTSTYGSRKGLVDTAMKTAASGYLTRKLVDVAQDVMITEVDCGTTHGILKFTTDAGSISFKISGRVTVEPVVHPTTEEVMAESDTLITPQIAQIIEEAEVPSVRVRSILTCEAEKGVCATCYGADLTSGQLVNVGEAIGIIAAQSIGEPGTQLTMRTFHTGGVVEDVSEGLARKILAKATGTVRYRDFIPGRTVREESGLWIAQQVAEHLDQAKYKVKTVEHPECKLQPDELLTEKQNQENLERFPGFEVENVVYEIAKVNHPDFIDADAGDDTALQEGQYLTELEYAKFSQMYSLLRCSEAKYRVESVKHQDTTLKPGTMLTESEADTWRAEIRPFDGEWVYLTDDGTTLTESEYLQKQNSVTAEMKFLIKSVTHPSCPFKEGKLLATEEESQYHLELSEPVYTVTEVCEGVDTKIGEELTAADFKRLQEMHKPFEVQRPSTLLCRVTNVMHPECPLAPGEYIELDKLEALKDKFSGFTADRLKYRITAVHHPECKLDPEKLLTENEKKAVLKEFPGFEVDVIKNEDAFEIDRLYRVVASHHPDFPVPVDELITQSESNRYRRSYKGFDFEKLYIKVVDGVETDDVLVETDYKALVKQHKETDTPLPELKLVYHVLAVHHAECPFTAEQQIDETEYKRAQRLYKGFDTERVFRVIKVNDADSKVTVDEILSDADYKKEVASTSRNTYKVTKVLHPNCTLEIGQELKDWEYNTALEQYTGVGVDGLIETFRIEIHNPEGGHKSHLIPAGYSVSVKDGEKVKAQLPLAELHEKTTNLDIVVGIPRVTELFEARRPKREDAAEIAEIDGTIQLTGQKAGVPQYRIVDGASRSRLYSIPDEKRRVDDGDWVEAGQPLTDGYLNPHDILAIGRTTLNGHSLEGEEALWTYLVDEVQAVYGSNTINDKHVEVIVRQMLQKIRILTVGDTTFYANDEVTRYKFHAENRRVEQDGGTPATGEPVLQSISKASLSTDSFISAASFQQTPKVLTDAAVEGQTDMLTGLKENVILGRLIPAGTGFSEWQELDVSYDAIEEQEQEAIPEELPEQIAEVVED